MSFESPDNEKDFPGLYHVSDQISVTEEDVEKGSKKKEGKKEKKEGKKEKKDKGYMMFEQEDSEEELVITEDITNIKSPSKIGRKIKPTFRFQKKDKSKERDEKKDKEGRKGDDKKKEEKEGKKEKHKLKEKKKSKHRDVTAHSAAPAGLPDKPVFGVQLSVAVDRSKCHDGIELPAIFRECVDYIEEHGLTCEGIYRISGVKSKVQQLKDCYNKSLPAYLCEHEANVVASLLKQFLRELPEPVLTTQLMPKFEEASTLKTEAKRVEAMRKLVQELPVCNRLLLSWMMVHMTHIIEHRTRNKMSLQNVSIVLSPTMQISHRVLNVFFCMVDKLFGDTQIKRYVPPLRPATSRWSLELPDNLTALEEELAKQESLLNALHEEFKQGVQDSSKEEQLWEVQRVVTQLKRKIKFAHKSSDRKKELESKKPAMVSELDELNLDLQPVTEAVVERVSESDKDEIEIKTEEIETKSDEENAISKETKDKAVEDSAESSLRSKDDDKAVEKLEESSKSESKVEENSTNVEGASSNVEEGASNDLEVKPSEEKLEKMDDDQKSPEADSLPMEPQQTPEIKTEEWKSTEDVTPVTTQVDIEIPSVKEETVDIETPSAKEETVSIETPSVKEETVVIATPSVKEETVIIETPSVKEETVAQMPVVKIPKKNEQLEKAIQPKTVKPSGPIQPHLQLSQQPLQPIRVSPQKLPSKQESSDSVDGEQFIPEKEYKSVPVSSEGDQPVQDEEMKKLLEEEYAMTLEEEELLSIGDELKQKIDTEQSEIERLKQEIVELQYLRQDSDLEDYSSTSESSDESEDEEELTEILNSLIAENEELEKKNSELCQKIQDERMACLDCKVSIRLIQQKQLDSDNILDTDNPI